jgi:hypothetical protein
MSNPLLRPNDPRFRKAPLEDVTGKNPFAEGQPVSAAAPSSDDLFAPSGGEEARPFQPQYVAQQQSRAGLYLVLACLGWVGAVLGAASLAGLFGAGWICPLLGTAPAAAAWLLAYEELKAIGVGAIDSGARPRARLAMIVGLFSLAGCLAVVGSMIYRQMNFLPELF